MNMMSEDVKAVILETADIGGTNTGATGNWATYQSMENFDRIYAKVEVGTWDATDDLDTCKLQQAQDAAGTGVKDLTTSASGGNYDTDAPVDADGNTVVLEARAEDLDTDGGFFYVRLYCAEVSNTGVDNISGVLVLYKARYSRKQLEGAASSGAVVYVRP